MICVLTTAFVFSLTLNERIREFSILRVLGADHSILQKIIFTEAGILGIIGSVIGLFVSALIIIPFNLIISEKIALPFAMSSPLLIIVFALIVFVISIVSCITAAIFSAIRISKFEVYGGAK